MNDYIRKRTVELAEYIAENKTTVRETAKKFGVSKSTVHKDVSLRLRGINPALYEKVRAVFDVNRETRHIRGGIATREKYLKIKKTPDYTGEVLDKTAEIC